MNRRGFLTCIAALTGAAAIPAGAEDAINALATASIENKSIWPAGVIREMMAYAIHADRTIVRYDILFGPGIGDRLSADGDEQFHVDFAFNSNKDAKALLPEQRQIARKLLEDCLIRKGRSILDCRPLYCPPGGQMI